ncbi:hypothetical protein SAMN06298226_3044 [Nitrosovibrio sp. Nv4]|nr:hypothetical protein SAMN06298226_3044 [Nitrosovibrio sp. Nv4]
MSYGSCLNYIYGLRINRNRHNTKKLGQVIIGAGWRRRSAIKESWGKSQFPWRFTFKFVIPLSMLFLIQDPVDT